MNEMWIDSLKKLLFLKLFVVLEFEKEKDIHITLGMGNCPECQSELSMNKLDNVDGSYDMSIYCSKCNWMKPVIVNSEDILIN